MKKINLFYLLFALGSFTSLGAANSDITEFCKLKFWESFIFKYNRYLDKGPIGLMSVKIYGNNQYFIVKGMSGLDKETLLYLNDALQKTFKNHEITKVLSKTRAGNYQFETEIWKRLTLFNPNALSDNSTLTKCLQKALKQRKGYDFFVDNNGQLEVKSFNIWEYNYRGISTLLAIPLALVLGTLYSLDFFSSSETEKKDEINYIE